MHRKLPFFEKLMSVFVFTLHAEQMLNNLTIKKVLGHGSQLRIIQGSAAYFLRSRGPTFLFHPRSRGPTFLFHPRSRDPPCKNHKTHPAAGALIYIPCFNITVAGALFSKKLKEPGQGPGLLNPVR